jgi:DNA ligase-associated metallophosphoesterase
MKQISFADIKLQLLPDKLLWIEELKLLCASDLHFEKGSFFSKFATLLPPYDSHETLERLESAVQLLKPEIFIALGDSFHDRSAGKRLDTEVKEKLSGLIAQVPRWIWIMGNHDPKIDETIAGERMEEAIFVNITFRHMLKAQDKGFEISGHFHPKISINLHGQKISGPCFVRSANRLIMPSFGSYTGGLLVSSPDFTGSLPEPCDKFFLAYQGGVYSVG